MKVIDIDCIVRNMMNAIEGAPSMKIKIELYADVFLNIDLLVELIKDKIIKEID